MGDDFNFLEWCDQWLKTAGVNILEPVVEYNEDFSIKSLSLKQTCDLRGKNRLRKQKLHIALYHGDDSEPHIIKDVIISDREELNKIEVDFKGPVKAILHNFEDHAYALTRYDERTLDFIINDLYKVKSELERVVIWTQMWQMVTRCKLSALKYYNFVVQQYPHETSQQILSSSLMYLSALINQYMPPQMVEECKEKMFDILMTVLQKNMGDDALMTPVVDNMFSFTTSKDQVNLSLSWVDKKYIHTAAEPGKKIHDLQANNLRSICKTVFKSPHLTNEEKMQLLEKVIGDDKSDIAKNVRIQCEASIPDPAVKEQVWKEITDPNSEISIKERQSKMMGFYARSQFDICKPYADKYYEELKDFDKKHSNKYVEAFMHNMRPTMEILDSHIVKLVAIKGNVPDTSSAYKKQLEENIELLIRCKTLREMAVQD